MAYLNNKLFIIKLLNRMTERRESVTQMTSLNQKLLDQNNQIKNITRVANEANAVQINTLEALNRQGEQIARNIDVVGA